MLRSLSCDSIAAGNVKRSHQVLYQKIYYVVRNQKKNEVDWVKTVSACMKYLNADINDSQKKELVIESGQKVDKMHVRDEKKNKCYEPGHDEVSSSGRCNDKIASRQCNTFGKNENARSSPAIYFY